MINFIIYLIIAFIELLGALCVGFLVQLIFYQFLGFNLYKWLNKKFFGGV